MEKQPATSTRTGFELVDLALNCNPRVASFVKRGYKVQAVTTAHIVLVKRGGGTVFHLKNLAGVI